MHVWIIMVLACAPHHAVCWRLYGNLYFPSRRACEVELQHVPAKLHPHCERPSPQEALALRVPILRHASRKP